ncbi:type II secretion system minor pseudopilin GspH [Rheinheimera maricola]|uniref:Type II secretion system protein H n=1 Tax=Rheinheimera maricola TaxID=2793282 RepID=A0ABS7XCE8_9GAMM|nr:type II secretion system minor pseudopilin GspH [Rheinheimera maricola]MBZ9613026.1 type II secretion system minor pseudopilin GspH [Rheinheimera maricola]
MCRQLPTQCYRRGFTLVEVMLVMLLIGLLATTVVMNFSGESREERLDKEAERVQQLFQFVAETAMLKQQEWGLYVRADRYGFLYYNTADNKWLEAEEPAGLQQYKLPTDISLSLELEGLPGEDSNLLSQLDWQLEDAEQTDDETEVPVLPQVFILSSGEISPFQLLLTESSDLTLLYSSISTDFAIPLSRTMATTEKP